VIENFHHEIRLDQLRGGERVELAADAGECKTIGKRLGLDELERLEASASLDKKGEIVRATGRVQAALTQHCVVTGDPIATLIDEPFDLVFQPSQPDSAADSEIELAADDCDTVFYDGAAIALGDAIADTLALAIDPYPRSAGADAALKEAGVLSEAEAGPFAALAALKGKLSDDA
jgi:uncharacterized metal-binding protein YceD (DUF177 family)